MTGTPTACLMNSYCLEWVDWSLSLLDICVSQAPATPASWFLRPRTGAPQPRSPSAAGPSQSPERFPLRLPLHTSHKQSDLLYASPTLCAPMSPAWQWHPGYRSATSPPQRRKSAAAVSGVIQVPAKTRHRRRERSETETPDSNAVKPGT